MNKKVAKSDLMCLKCGEYFPTWKDKGTQRKMFERKVLYCPKCCKNTNHVELQNIDLYKASLEFIEENTLTEEEKEIYQLIKKR